MAHQPGARTRRISAGRYAYAGREWVARKGATPAFPGQKGFIGGSMGDDAVIVRGTPEADWPTARLQREALFSTVHGAGRDGGDPPHAAPAHRGDGGGRRVRPLQGLTLRIIQPERGQRLAFFQQPRGLSGSAPGHGACSTHPRRRRSPCHN